MFEDEEISDAAAEADEQDAQKIEIADLISSPLQRAVQTAEIIGARHGLDVARDPRLIEMDAGQWAGMTHAEVSASPEYQRFLSNPDSIEIPGGENLTRVRTRAVAALQQSLADSPSGSSIAIVSHAGVIRILLAHFLGSPPANYHRIRVAPGSVSVLSFADDRELPGVLATNCVAGLTRVLRLQEDQ